MRPQRQSGQTLPRTRAASSGLSVLEICAQLTDSSADPAALLETLAASARQLFQATAAEMLVKDGETPVLKNRVAQPPSAVALLSQAQPFAEEAISKNNLVSFRLTPVEEKKSACYGLAQPLITAQSVQVLLVLREKAFTQAESFACSTLGSVCRLALENRELAGLSSG